MPRRSIALFLATTGLVTALTGCSPGPDAGEKGGQEAKPSPGAQPAPAGHNGPKPHEGGEGGEGGEG